jgi:hypothetical protein
MKSFLRLPGRFQDPYSRHSRASQRSIILVPNFHIPSLKMSYIFSNHAALVSAFHVLSFVYVEFIALEIYLLPYIHTMAIFFPALHTMYSFTLNFYLYFISHPVLLISRKLLLNLPNLIVC